MLGAAVADVDDSLQNNLKSLLSRTEAEDHVAREKTVREVKRRASITDMEVKRRASITDKDACAVLASSATDTELA